MEPSDPWSEDTTSFSLWVSCSRGAVRLEGPMATTCTERVSYMPSIMRSMLDLLVEAREAQPDVASQARVAEVDPPRLCCLSWTSRL